MQQHATILILDFGSQYTQLIARRVREMGVYCVILPCQSSTEQITAVDPVGVILSGGPDTVTVQNSFTIPEIVLQLKVPVLGICYGMQVLAQQLGGQVVSSKMCEFGAAQLELTRQSVLFQNFPKQKNYNIWMSHGDQVAKLPRGFVGIARTANTTYAAMECRSKSWYGVQFHPEVTHTTEGMILLKNFVLKICHCQPTWQQRAIIKQKVEQIRKVVGNEKVLLGLSGGVDSAVAALLLQRALGKNLVCVFVDTGMLRLNEHSEVQQLFSQHLQLNVHYVNAASRFLKALRGISDPEKKRKIIGHLFIDIFREQVKHFKTKVQWLAQGTIYSDVIESARTLGGATQVIKSHHNVGGLPKKLGLKLIEPLRDLFKDEVRKIGLKLGLPRELIERHPFPGPGLGIRVLGEVTKKALDQLRLADHIFLTELRSANFYHRVSQAFAVFLPVKSVGVMGDQRKYAPIIALRAVKSSDFMTATRAVLPNDFLDRVANRIVNEVPGISRVVYDITSKPPATIEYE